VRKKLKLKLNSKKIDGTRVHSIKGADGHKASVDILNTEQPDRHVPVKIGRVLPDIKALEIEIARLRDLDVRELRARWQNKFRRRPPPHLSR
jgi:hypothetical protein